jgi:hypothetical protein
MPLLLWRNSVARSDRPSLRREPQLTILPQLFRVQVNTHTNIVAVDIENPADQVHN